MREIKFRVWDVENKRMVKATYFWCKPDGTLLLDSIWEKDGSFRKGHDSKIGDSDDFILMQYTGLKDKNGKEIYEGDIIIATLVNNLLRRFVDYKGVVEFWSDSDFCFGIRWGESHERFPLMKIKGHVFGFDKIPSGNYHTGTSPEIIGNIYENPELLKGGE